MRVALTSMATFLCLRCLILKANVPQIGKDFDMNWWKSQARKYSPENIEIACKAIFDLGRSINYKGEYDLLKEGSWVPTRVRYSCLSSWIYLPLSQNAYFEELSLNPSLLMAVDLMHNIELGINKAIITHILWLLLAVGEGVIKEFDARSVSLEAANCSFIQLCAASSRSLHLAMTQ